MNNNSSCLVAGMVFIKGLLPGWVKVLHRGLQVELAREDVDQAGPVPAQEGPPVLRSTSLFQRKRQRSPDLPGKAKSQTPL